MSETVDYIKQVEERRKEAEKAEHGGLTEEEYQKKAEKEAAAAIHTEHAKSEAEVEEAKKRSGFINSDTDHTDDTDPTTGRTRINGQDLGSASREGESSENRAGGESPRENAGRASDIPAPQVPVGKPTLSRKDFMPDSKSFFNADVKNGFWDTLEDKINKAFQGKAPEEMAENMFFAALDMFFDTLINAIEHYRKDRQHREGEADKAIENYENQQGFNPDNKRVCALIVGLRRQGYTGEDALEQWKNMSDEQRKELGKKIQKDMKTSDYRKEYTRMAEKFVGVEQKEKNVKNDLKVFRKHGFEGVVEWADLSSPLFANAVNNGAASQYPAFAAELEKAKLNKAELDGLADARKQIVKERELGRIQQGQNQTQNQQQSQQQGQRPSSGRDAA